MVSRGRSCVVECFLLRTVVLNRSMGLGAFLWAVQVLSVGGGEDVVWRVGPLLLGLRQKGGQRVCGRERNDARTAKL